MIMVCLLWEVELVSNGDDKIFFSGGRMTGNEVLAVQSGTHKPEPCM